MEKLNFALSKCLVGIIGVAASAASAEDRYGVEPPGQGSFGDVIVGLLIVGIGYLVADIAFRAVNGRAPSSVERIVWTAMLVFGGAVILGVFRKW